RNRIEGEPPAVPQVPKVLGSESFAVKPVELEPEAFYPGLHPFIRSEERAKAQAAVSTAAGEVEKARNAARTSRQSLAALRAQSQQPVTAANPPKSESLLPAEIASVDAQSTLD